MIRTATPQAEVVVVMAAKVGRLAFQVEVALAACATRKVPTLVVAAVAVAVSAAAALALAAVAEPSLAGVLAEVL